MLDTNYFTKLQAKLQGYRYGIGYNRVRVQGYIISKETYVSDNGYRVLGMIRVRGPKWSVMLLVSELLPIVQSFDIQSHSLINDHYKSTLNKI
jgi:hypothetical protein